MVLTAAAFPLDQHRTEFTAVAQADSNGQVQFAGFNIDNSHLGQRFLVTATGSESQAQTLFTDGSPDATSITLNLSSASQTYGTAVTVSGKVTDTGNAVNNPVTAGNVNVQLDGVSVQNSSVDSSGNYTYTSPTTITPGTHNFTVSYAGSGIWGASAAGPTTYTATVSVLVTAPGAGTPHFTFGTSVAFTATVTGAGGAPAINNGTLNFIDTSNGNAAIGSISVAAGTGTVNSNTLQGTIAHTVAAQYSPAPADPYTTTSPGVPFAIDKATPTITITTLPVSPTVDDAVTITVAITPLAGITRRARCA